MGRVTDAGLARETDARGKLWEEFARAMDDDFNSARAQAAVFEAVKKGNKMLDKANDAPKGADAAELTSMLADIRAISGILGIFSMDPKDYFSAKKEKGMADQEIDPAMVEDLIAQRVAARKEKNFARADEIRDELQAMHIVLEDGPGGTVWHFEQ